MHKLLTWMFSFPNSFARLWLSALRPNLPAANALVVTFPRIAAVAPVKSSVPLLPRSSSSFCLNARTAPRENAKAAVTLVWRDVSMSLSVTSRKGLKTPVPAFQSATRSEEDPADDHLCAAMSSKTDNVAPYE